uniref:Sodium/nucleoside cotransporter n=1 Tax=Syphacia muris TaxID=451379 RepID=A0A0N5AZ92_9BILA
MPDWDIENQNQNQNDQPGDSASLSNKPGTDDASVSLELKEMKKNGDNEPKTTDGENVYAEPEYLDEKITGPMRIIAWIQTSIESVLNKYSKYIKWAVFAAIVALFHVWLGFAIDHSFDRAETIMIFTCIAWALTIYYCIVKKFFGKIIYKNIIKKLITGFDYLSGFLIIRLAVYLIIFAAIIVFIVIDTRNNRKRLMGLCGMVFFLALMFLLSTNRAKINWRPVVWGYLVQFIFGLLILRWPWGERTFRKASDQIVRFLDYTNNGTEFVYGFLANPPNICGMSPVFAFSSIQVVVYFGSIVSLLYYYGIMQIVLKKMAWFMQITLGTTATESLNACACIFLGQSEAPLLIKPYIVRMTASEIHAIMTSGFSCIAGSLFAAYISFGACPLYLLSATFMSAPGSLACSKILYPETEESQVKHVEDLELPAGEESNALECISNGAVMAVDLVLAIVANLIVFLALLAFADNVVGWIMSLVGYENWSLERLLGYIFFPVAYIMGVTDHGDTLKVARLMGTKTILNEFIAYQQLGQLGLNHELSSRSQMIATYALCGFSNFSSIGIQLGVLGGMAPTKKPLLSKLAIRALLAGCISCFWTASLAGNCYHPLKC